MEWGDGMSRLNGRWNRDMEWGDILVRWSGEVEWEIRDGIGRSICGRKYAAKLQNMCFKKIV